METKNTKPKPHVWTPPTDYQIHISPEQTEFLSEFDDDAAWLYKRKRRGGTYGKDKTRITKRQMTAFVTISPEKTHLIFHDHRGKQYASWRTASIIYHFGSVENFLFSACIPTKLSYEEWMDELSRPVPTPLSKKKLAALEAEARADANPPRRKRIRTVRTSHISSN